MPCRDSAAIDPCPCTLAKAEVHIRVRPQTGFSQAVHFVGGDGAQGLCNVFKLDGKQAGELGETPACSAPVIHGPCHGLARQEQTRLQLALFIPTGLPRFNSSGQDLRDGLHLAPCGYGTLELQAGGIELQTSVHGVVEQCRRTNQRGFAGRGDRLWFTGAVQEQDMAQHSGQGQRLTGMRRPRLLAQVLALHQRHVGRRRAGCVVQAMPNGHCCLRLVLCNSLCHARSRPVEMGELRVSEQAGGVSIMRGQYFPRLSVADFTDASPMRKHTVGAWIFFSANATMAFLATAHPTSKEPSSIPCEATA